MTPYDDFPPRQPAPQPHRLAALFLLVVAVGLGFGAYYLYQHWFGSGKTGVDPTAEMRPVTPRGELPGAEKDRVEMLARVKPSVAFITTYDVRRDIFSSD